jgi:hypothetical protein
MPTISSWAPRVVGHRLHREALDARVGPRRAHVLEHGPGRVAHLLGIGESEHDPADVRLVRDVGREDLQRDRTAEGCGRMRRLVGAPRDGGRHDRNAIRVQHLLRFDLAEPCPLLVPRAVEDRLCASDVGSEGFGDRGRHLA